MLSYPGNTTWPDVSLGEGRDSHLAVSCRFVNHVEFHPSGTCIASGGTDNTVKVKYLLYL